MVILCPFTVPDLNTERRRAQAPWASGWLSAPRPLVQGGWVTPPVPRPALACFSGAAAPSELFDDVCVLSRLPPAARASFWRALGPSLPEPIPASLEEHLDRFVLASGADGEELARALKACRFVVREASRRGLSRAQFEADCALLLPHDPDGARILAEGFEQGREVVRRELAEAAIVRHGKLLVGVDWRVDTIRSSKEASALGQAVVMLTLTYREGDRTERVTLQALPHSLAELGALANAVSGG